MNRPARPAFYRLGLTGYPLGHSFSPHLHLAALRAAGLAGDYRLYPVAPDADCDHRLGALAMELRAGQMHGLNVTIPHKQRIMAQVDHLSPLASAVGAINTLYARDGLVCGENTDVGGFLYDLNRLWRLPPGSALILGAGGSARAAAYALAREGWQVRVAARRFAQAAQLAAELNRLPECAGRLSAVEFAPEQLSRQNTGLCVNATPLGMVPQAGASPWPEDISLPEGCAVYDLVYNPLETRLVRTAAAQGHRAAGGIGMLAAQAALAFALWTGLDAPFAVMLRAALDLRDEGEA